MDSPLVDSLPLVLAGRRPAEPQSTFGCTLAEQVDVRNTRRADTLCPPSDDRFVPKTELTQEQVGPEILL